MGQLAFLCFMSVSHRSLPIFIKELYRIDKGILIEAGSGTVTDELTAGKRRPRHENNSKIMWHSVHSMCHKMGAIFWTSPL